jgi:hypothetical protein
MANFDRNAYEPSDEVRLYDSVDEEEDIEGSRLPLLIVLALLVLAMFAGVVWLAYTQGVARGRGETPVLTAANGPERVTPQQPGGTNVPYQGFKIYEQPAPPDDAADAPAAAPVAQEPKPAPAAAAPAPAAPRPAPPKSVASLIQQAQTPPPIRPTVPATPTGPATGAPRSIVPAAPPPAATPKPAASGGVALQIGAFKTRAEADAAWRAYSGKHAALLKGYGPEVQEADLGDKGTWYRLRIAGFRDSEMASALCDRLKADGGGCFLGR